MPRMAAVTLCDLESAANYGLFQASLKYKEELGPFEAYARLRARGAILDYLRSLDLVGRAERQRIKASGEPDYHRELDVSEVPNLRCKTQSPEAVAIRRQRSQRIQVLINLLPDREKELVALRHEEDLTLQEIGKRWKLHESRISQIQKSTHASLRHLLAGE